MKSLLPGERDLLLTTIGFLSFLIMTLATAAAPSHSAEIQSNQLVKLETRPGVTQKLILIKPDNPAASVIMFVGGKGQLKLGSSLSGEPTVKGRTYFLVRAREDFAKQGLVVAVVDAPSDMAMEKKGMATFSRETKTIFRMRDEHRQDIEAVVEYLKSQMNIPVWLVGTSTGTISAALGSINIPEGIEGLVLISPVTLTRKTWHMNKTHPNGVLDVGLDKIKVPTLIISHQNDKCDVTPASGAPKVKAALANSAKVETRYFTGGKGEKGEPCSPLSASGFYGIEDEVIAVIADFIKANSKSLP